MDGLDRWNWSTEEIKRVGYKVVDLIAAYLMDAGGGRLSGER